jgi:hypothetical protein
LEGIIYNFCIKDSSEIQLKNSMIAVRSTPAPGLAG